MKRFVLLLALVSAFLITGCAKKQVVQPPTVTPQPPVVEEPAKKKVIKPEERIAERPSEEVESAEELSKYSEERGLFSDINFYYDSYEIRPSSKEVLDSVAAWLQQNPKARLLIEGHCDERGTNEYNLALGDRRAGTVKEYLSTLGITSGRIDTISYGEEKPVCTESTEECWQKNRRAHFVVLREAGK